MITTIIAVVTALVLVAVSADAIYSFVKGDGSFRDRLLAIGKSSATVAAARGGMILGLGLDTITQAADILVSPAVSGAVSQYIDIPTAKYVLVGASIIAEWSRRRSLIIVTPATIAGGPLEKAPIVGLPEVLKAD